MDPLSLLLIATLAQSADTAPVVTYKEVTELDFPDVEVSTDLVRPTGSVLFERKRGEFAPLIALRRDFNAEIGQSTDLVR